MHIVFARQSFDRFNFNEGDCAAGAGMRRIRAGLSELAVTLDPPPRHRQHFVHDAHLGAGRRRDVQRYHGTRQNHGPGYFRLLTSALISGVCTPSFSKLHVPFSRISWASLFAPVIAAFVKPEP